ncbi:3-deoxy-D-manno-octulosonic acid transferase [Arcticibacterium luteifluviistationis]|uniref:3-deoxy-D-manno-octulosonic acid transferase n=1 Tax=Arcticibacterium luteifluviistationis TaxID=1784714 RepID=A0A2Z4G9U7_9BACT|nr:glycosyltransferase N-terminal domain-containing protein [Arcticibacterium luteifluviistationis]AWV97924.1 3-deoxy-D-manno-octulosonic acid transferase [Arcticibacterium luteifluviistationis]
MTFILDVLYSFSIHFFNLGLKVASLFSSKAKLRANGQNNWKGFVSERDLSKPLAWFHCASLGEFEQGRPVIEAYKKRNPDHQILLTFFSPSGYEVRKNYGEADIICYLPLDLKSNVNQFLEVFKPEIAFFVKYEFWRNFIAGLKERQVPVVSFSTIFRASQMYFKSFGGFARKPLLQIDKFFVQNQESADLLKKIGQNNVEVAGDTRFDRVADTLKTIREIEVAKVFKNNKKTLVGGSVWPEDMEVLIPFINKSKDLKFILAPHEIKDKQMTEWESQMKSKLVVRFSKADKLSDLANYDVLIIDNVGMLSSLYQYGEFAFIGGGFATGLHNILEAATFGMPIFFGDKSFKKFQEATDLMKEKGAFCVTGFDDFSKTMETLLSDSAKYAETKNITSQYVKNHTGATDVILNWLEGN